MPEPAASPAREHPLLRRLAALGLETADFVIFGSAPLLAHGLRPAIRDLDIVARGTAWERARQCGLPATGTITGAEAAQFWDGRITFFRHWITPHWNTDDLISRAEVIDGLRFAPLTDVLAYKLMLQRPKDIADIQAITQSCLPGPAPDAPVVAENPVQAGHRGAADLQ